MPGGPEIEALKALAANNQSWADWATFVVFIGLLGEIGITFAYTKNKPRSEIVLGIICGVIIALGVLGELRFGSRASQANTKLRIDSEAKLADAEDRLGKAESGLRTAIVDTGHAEERAGLANKHAKQLEVKAEQLHKENLDLEAELSPRRFKFQNAAGERLRLFAGTASVVLMYLNDVETRRTAEQIAYVLYVAKIRYVPLPNRDQDPFRVQDGVVIENVFATGSGTELREAVQAFDRSEPFCKALVEELNRTGIKAMEGLSSLKTQGVLNPRIAPGTIIIEVGMKPSPIEMKKSTVQDNSANRLGLPR
jgi:hypothetical protein